MALVENFRLAPLVKAKETNRRDDRRVMIHLFGWLIAADLIAIVVVATLFTAI
jgi:hypothetical protein